MSKKDTLFQIADSQPGYFTSLQAEECGYARSHFQQYIHSGEWSRELRGIYRLARYPVTERPDLVAWALWSRTKGGHVQGVWSHETALDVYELSDNMPSKMHMTVPSSFRKRSLIPSQLVLHYANLKEQEMRTQQGYLITTPLRTLVDVTEEGALSYDLLLQAVTEALERGIVIKKEIDALPEDSKLRQMCDDIKI